MNHRGGNKVIWDNNMHEFFEGERFSLIKENMALKSEIEALKAEFRKYVSDTSRIAVLKLS